MDQIRDIDAKESFDILLDRVEHGEEIVITRDGKPVARMVQAQPQFDREAALAAVERIKERSKTMSLRPDTIGELKHMGHKY
jgi:prevent-host-death family protein